MMCWTNLERTSYPRTTTNHSQPRRQESVEALRLTASRRRRVHDEASQGRQKVWPQSSATARLVAATRDLDDPARAPDDHRGQGENPAPDRGKACHSRAR